MLTFDDFAKDVLKIGSGEHLDVIGEGETPSGREEGEVLLRVVVGNAERQVDGAQVRQDHLELDRAVAIEFDIFVKE
jgi:hypothetical protein